MGRRGRASACPRSRTGQVIWLAAALLLLAIAVLALWLYETNGAPDGQSAETRQVPPIPPAGGEGLPPAVRNGQAVVQTVADTAAVVRTPAPADAASQTILREVIERELHTLTPREEHVIKLRFGLYDGRTRTLEEVGKEFDITRERIRQIEAKALRKLRHPSRARHLKGFLD